MMVEVTTVLGVIVIGASLAQFVKGLTDYLNGVPLAATVAFWSFNTFIWCLMATFPAPVGS